MLYPDILGCQNQENRAKRNSCFPRVSHKKNEMKWDNPVSMSFFEIKLLSLS